MPMTALGQAAEARHMSLFDRTGLIIPTLNAGSHFTKMLPALSHQGIDLRRVLVIDSSSDDDTVERARSFGLRVEIIPRKDFNHGGTRRYATRLLSDQEFLVFLTQDAFPSDAHAVSRLVSAFENPEVGMAYGRQLPRTGARAIERHARIMNYPAHSQLRSLEDRTRLGARTLFCSNSFAAYRRTALEAVGGFPEDVFFAEDQIVAGAMLIAGWKLAYQADACVYHSHGYTMREEFKRYFDVGVFHARNPWILETFGKVEGEGLRYVGSEITYLARHEPLSVPSALARTALKYAAYHIGKREARLSPKWKSRLSMQSFYWRSHPTGGRSAQPLQPSLE
jgi:rhamnosyltransferase